MASTAEASVVGGAIRDVTAGTYFGISVEGTVKSPCRTARELARKSFQMTVLIAVD